MRQFSISCFAVMGLLASLLMTCCIGTSPNTVVQLTLVNEEGVVIGNVPCVSLPGPNGHPFGAYWNNDDNQQHSFVTSQTDCIKKAQLSFDTITGFDSNRGCPESFVWVDISYSVDNGAWIPLGSLNPSNFRQQHLVTLSLTLHRPGRVKFRFQSRGDDSGVWSFWNVAATYKRKNNRLCQQVSSSVSPSHTPSTTVSPTASITPVSHSLTPSITRTPTASITPVSHSLTPSVTMSPTASITSHHTGFNALDYFGLRNFPILNQEGCGSCYAFAAMTVLTYRKMIAGWDISTGGIATPQTILDCGENVAWFGESGCGGGYEFYALDMDTGGIGSCGTDSCHSGCIPYRCGSGTCVPDTHTCRNKCSTNPGDGPILYGHGSYPVTDIRAELMTRGPVTVFMAIYDNFFFPNPTDVYESCSGAFLGYHVVVIVGWDTDAGGDYWILQNSWGSSWGDGGFFRVRVGVDCLFVGRVYGTLSGDPTLTSTSSSSPSNSTVAACVPTPLDINSDIVKRIANLMSASIQQETPQIISATSQIVAGVKFQVTIQGPNNSLITSTFLYGAPSQNSQRHRSLRSSSEVSLELLSTVIH